MKKNSILAAAAVLILSTDPASARFANGTGFDAGTNNGPSSLIFSLVNEVDKRTFVFNLALPTTTGLTGLNYADFAGGNAPTFQGNANGRGVSQRVLDAVWANPNNQIVWDLTAYPQFQTFHNEIRQSASVNNGVWLRWSVLGSYEKDNQAGTNLDKYGVEPEFVGWFTDTHNQQWGALTTAPGIQYLDPNNIQDLINTPSVVGVSGAYFDRVNSRIRSEGEPNTNVAVLEPVGNEAWYDTVVPGWQPNLGPGLPHRRGLGDYGFFWATNPTAAGQNVFFEVGKFTLSPDGTLAFTSPVPVPVPAALWLFGSALAGFLAVSRRRA